MAGGSKKLPAFQFYPGDWMKDPALRACSLAARGLWIDMTCLLFEMPRRGFMEHSTGAPVTESQIARMVGCDAGEFAEAFQELESAGVFSRDKAGVIYSRRMARDEEVRQSRVTAGSKGGSKTQAKRKAKSKQAGKQNQSSSSSSSSSSSTTEESSYEDSCPEPSGDGTEPAEQPVMLMPCTNTGTKPREWPVMPAKVAEWQEAFPGIDVLTELHKARQWLRDNPTRKKTYAGMSRYLGSWLSRAQNESRPNSRGQPPGGRQPPDKMAGAAEFLAGVSSGQRRIGGFDAQ